MPALVESTIDMVNHPIPADHIGIRQFKGHATESIHKTFRLCCPSSHLSPRISGDIILKRGKDSRSIQDRNQAGDGIELKDLIAADPRPHCWKSGRRPALRRRTRTGIGLRIEPETFVVLRLVVLVCIRVGREQSSISG